MSDIFANPFGKATPIQKLKKARVKLNEEKPFFGYLSMRLVFHRDDSVGTIGVDKNGNCYYNEDFIDKLNQMHVDSLLAHEVMHCALQHMTRVGGKDKELWNISTDAVINALLIKDGMSLPEGGVLPFNDELDILEIKIPDVHKKSANEVYDKLYNNWKKQKKKDGYSGVDKHIYTDDDSDGNSNGTGSTSSNVDWEKELVEASTFAKLQGKLPAGIKRLVDGLLGNVIDWRGLLYKYIQNSIPFDYTWMKPNKKSYATKIYMPDIIKEKIDIICSIDTSGSISQKELKTFLSELLGIINAFENVELNVIFNDTEVYGPHTFQNPTPDDIVKLKPEGGGGTDHNPVFEWVYKNNNSARLLICFTDGYTSFPKRSSIDTIWVLAGYHCEKEHIPFGRVIELPREK